MAGQGGHLRLIFAVLAVAAAMQFAELHAQATCDRKEFEAVVAGAAKALRDLNQKNKPAFQARLRELMAKRGWSHDQLMKDGAAFVQDASIAEYDDRSNAALESIQRIGSEGASSQNPSCAALEEVRGLMQTLVSIQTDKWVYMFDKIDQELKR